VVKGDGSNKMQDLGPGFVNPLLRERSFTINFWSGYNVLNYENALGYE